MKSKTLVMMTATIIMAAAIILTAGLSLLHISAIAETPTPTESVVPVSTPSLTDEAEVKVEEKDYPSVDASEYEDDDTTPNSKDVVIDIYEHATGKLVSQVVIDSEPIYM